MSRHRVAPPRSVNGVHSMNFDRRMRSEGKPVPEEHTTLGPPMFPVNRTCPGMSGVVVAEDRVGGVAIVSAGIHVKRADAPAPPVRAAASRPGRVGRDHSPAHRECLAGHASEMDG